MKASKLANFAAAAVVATGLAGAVATAAYAGGGHNPPGHDDDPVGGCNGQPNCPGDPGDDGKTTTINNNVDVKNDIKNDIDVDNNNTNNNTNNNDNTNVNNNKNTNNNNSNATNSVVVEGDERQVGNAPAVLVSANGKCKWGIGASIGTMSFTGGGSFTGISYKCLDYETATYLIETGLKFKRGELALLGVTTLNNVSKGVNISTKQLSEAYMRCGAKSLESNLVLGSNAAVNGGPCPIVEGRTRTETVISYNKGYKKPRVTHDVDSKRELKGCESVVEQAKICMGKFPQLKIN